MYMPDDFDVMPAVSALFSYTFLSLPMAREAKFFVSRGPYKVTQKWQDFDDGYGKVDEMDLEMAEPTEEGKMPQTKKGKGVKKDKATILGKDEYFKPFSDDQYCKTHLRKAPCPVGQPKSRSFGVMVSLPLQGMYGKRVTQKFL